MQNLENKLLEATKDILIKNLKITEKPFSEQKKILVFDKNSILAEKISDAYLKNFLEIEKKCFLKKIFGKIFKIFGINKYQNNFEFFDVSKWEGKKNTEELKNNLKNKLLNLEENSTVVLIQSTNFRLDNFRIRLNLHNRGIGCLEHNHLGYIKNDQLETYADCIKYRTPYYNAISEWLKEKADKCSEIIIESHDGSKLIGTSDKGESGELLSGFEDMKQNTLNFDGKRRGGSLPGGENFNEIKNFDNLNGELSIYCFPGEDFQIITTKPFKIKIEKSLVKKIEGENYPPEFLQILEKIEKGEDGEVFLRELGFGLNPGISRKNQLSDVNAHERIEGFHVSLGKKHNIYRKKFHRKISQRYHIDIFPDTKNIFMDGVKIFESDRKTEKFLFPDREKFGE